MSTHESDSIPVEFRELWDSAARLILPQRDERQPSGLHLLPPSLRRAADLVEQSAAYRHFVDASLWDPKPSAWRMREAMRRAGFYQELQAAGEPTAVWRLLEARLKPHAATLRTLALLDGCWFPLEQFSVGGASIERLPADELMGLGPAPDVASVFFPTETLDPSWYTRVWFLVKEEQRDIKPTSISVRFGYDVLNQFWAPILALALYKTEFFGLPIVLESDRGWRLERVRWSEPMFNIVDDRNGESVEVPRTDYDVDANEQRRFAAFLAFFDAAIPAAREFKMFRLAGRRYLRAIQIAGPYPLTGDDFEDALLQYVFALEALLSAGDREAIGDKLATRAAWLIGTSDRTRNEIFKAVKKLYGSRSAVVHGGAIERKNAEARALDEIRDLMRRILVGLMALRRAARSDDECLRLLQTAAFDQTSQSEIAGATGPVWGLIDAGIEWPGPTWGPKYDQFAFAG